MSTLRLTFLYPPLFRSLRISEPVSRGLRPRHRPVIHQCLQRRKFASTASRRAQFAPRVGKGVEPIIHEDEEDMEEVEAARKEAKTTEEMLREELRREATANPSSASPLSEETQAAARLPGDLDMPGPPTTNSEIKKEEKEKGKVGGGGGEKQTSGPMETVLEMPMPESAEEENAAKPPHLQTPPYVHHFDTYTLVQQVQEGGFTAEQAITGMKAVRGLLALNLDVAKAGLVSKSDVENESYLFRAACSELKTEIQNNRKKNEETMRRERTLLQHEVEILNQKLTQELLSLKDDLKGMFDDRKMAVRMEQRAMESKIQELNYKITVQLNSDSKSEVEGLRWVLTRRSVMGILFMAFMVLTSLRYASYLSHEAELERKKEAAHKIDEAVEDLPAQGAAEILAAN